MSFQPPVIRSSFIGRDAELAALERLLERPDARLITVTGVGGVGKTRLVSELVARMEPLFPGGIWFVPVAHVHEHPLVLAAIAAELGIRDVDERETFHQIAGRLGGERALVVLDTLEQVIESGPALARLLLASPTLTILATSRQPLQLQGEIEFPLRPLRIDGNGDPETPAEALFAMRARESSYGFAVNDENRSAIRQISCRLEGIPLAIELAASWVKVLPPQRLLDNLDRQLDVLVRGPRDLPERQQTMRSAISWSFQLLSEFEQAQLRQLSVFGGPFTLRDVEAVTLHVEGVGEHDLLDLIVLETLASLVTKSLVQVADDPIDPSEPEYDMLAIIRAFGLEQLAAAGEATMVRDRHLAHFVALAEQWTADLSSAQRDRRMAQLDREYPNFRTALEWAAESGQRESGLRLVASLWQYWDWRGFHSEGARWRDRILELEGESDLALLSNALYAGAAIAFMQANYVRSMELAEACLATAEESGNESAIAKGLVALGNVTYDRGALDRSEEYYARSLQMSRQADHVFNLQVSIGNLGFVYYQQGRIDEARALFDEALGLESRTGHSAAAAWVRIGLAHTDRRLGNPAAAEQELSRVIEIQRAADTGQLAAALAALAALYRTQDRFGEAEPLVRESISNRVERDERALLTDSISEFAALAICSGLLEEGVVLAAAVAAQRARIGYGLPDQDWKAHQQIVESARSSLGEKQFEKFWARGDRMTISETLALIEGIVLADLAPKPVVAVSVHGELEILTPRELEVLRLIVEGKTDREIARELFISSGTASRHVANILHKVDVSTRSAAAAWAIRNGLT